MLTKINVSIIFFVIIGMCSCSKPRLSSVVSLSFSSNIKALNNGFILFGKSSDGRSFLKKIVTDKIKLDFYNDSWSFFAVGWEKETIGENGAFEGKVYCGKLENVRLLGDDYNLKLDMTNSNCGDHAFTYSATIDTNKIVHFPNRDFVVCKSIYDISNYSDINTCDRLNKNRGYATYLKISLPEFEKYGDDKIIKGEGLQSKCIAVDSHSNYGQSVSTNQDKFISPLSLALADSNDSGVEYTISLFYTDEGCVSPKIALDVDEVVLTLMNTARGKTFASTKKITDSVTPSTLRTFLAADEKKVCQGSRLTTLIAGGVGTTSAPYLLCTPAQMKNYTSQPEVFKDKSFELSGDMFSQF